MHRCVWKNSLFFDGLSWIITSRFSLSRLHVKCILLEGEKISRNSRATLASFKSPCANSAATSLRLNSRNWFVFELINVLNASLQLCFWIYVENMRTFSKHKNTLSPKERELYGIADFMLEFKFAWAMNTKTTGRWLHCKIGWFADGDALFHGH